MFFIIITPWEFFTSALADSLSLKFECQQVSSSLQDCRYSGQSQWYDSLDGLHSSAYLQVFLSLY